MRSLLLSLVSLYLIFSASCSDPLGKGDLAKNNLHGKVETITIYSYNSGSTAGKVTRGELAREEIQTYNKNGMITRDTYLEDGGKRKGTDIIYNYDDKGNLVECLRLVGNNEANKHRYVYTYDNSNHIIKELEYVHDSLLMKTLNKYNDRGNLVAIDRYNKSGDYFGGEKRTYDEKGNIIVNETYTTPDKLSYREENKYDDRNNIIEVSTYSGDGALSSKRSIKYNSRNDRVDFYLHDTTDTETNRATSEYIQYDNHGNWLIQDSYFELRPSQEIVRKIEYY